MTIDEAIKHAEEVAEEKEREAQDLEYSKLDWKYEANQCSECAEEHRQLAEWLRELKQLKEQEFCVTMRELSDDELKYLVEQMKKERWQLTLVKQEPREDIAKAFQLGLAFGFGKKYDEIDKIMEEVKKPFTPKQKTGRWITKIIFPTKLYNEHLNEYECSECGRRIRCTESQLVNYPYCHCGSKMEVAE